MAGTASKDSILSILKLTASKPPARPFMEHATLGPTRQS